MIRDAVMDRIIAALGGAAILMAWKSLQQGYSWWGVFGIILAAGCMWFCVPSPRRKTLGDILRAEDRIRLLRAARRTYDESGPDEYWTYFSASVEWCRAPVVHEPHLWPHDDCNESHVCMGYDYENPERHMAA